MQVSDIRESLRTAGINRGDTLMIHGDAIVASQLKLTNNAIKLEIFVQEVIDYLGSEGTLIIPTFTYSFTQNQAYLVEHSESKVGMFSEFCRKKFTNHRTMHPIFSVVAIGKNEKIFSAATITDCFGKNTIFDILYKTNAKLMNLGCDLMLTFTHFVEQDFSVSYRYFKDFKGDIVDRDNIIHKVVCRYFVGHLNLDYSLNLIKLKEKLLLNDALKISPFGRLASYTVSASEYYQHATDMLRTNEFSLINQGYHASK